mmetsp:Transcript_29907/g.48266  ORF Transcript_29907/g.48266 Transcript_29907/m.48266 type:complete len:233 (+) Transcript_29907:365-1063(+)
MGSVSGRRSVEANNSGCAPSTIFSTSTSRGASTASCMRGFESLSPILELVLLLSPDAARSLDHVPPKIAGMPSLPSVESRFPKCGERCDSESKPLCGTLVIPSSKAGLDLELLLANMLPAKLSEEERPPSGRRRVDSNDTSIDLARLPMTPAELSGEDADFGGLEKGFGNIFRSSPESPKLLAFTLGESFVCLLNLSRKPFGEGYPGPTPFIVDISCSSSVLFAFCRNCMRS